jgi:hypothetical protein
LHNTQVEKQFLLLLYPAVQIEYLNVQNLDSSIDIDLCVQNGQIYFQYGITGSIIPTPSGIVMVLNLDVIPILCEK